MVEVVFPGKKVASDMETWRMIVYCTAIFSYGTDNKKNHPFEMNVAVCVYTNIPIFFCFLVYVDNTRLLIHTSLYIVHISFTRIPRKFAEISLSPSASLGVDTKSLLLRAPKDGFLQLGSLSEYGDGGLLSTPLWDLRFSAAAALDGTSESESGDDFCVFHGFFWGVWGTKKYGGLPVGFFYLY